MSLSTHLQDLLTAADSPDLSYSERSVLLRRVLDSQDPYMAYQVAIRGFFVQSAQDIVCSSDDYRTQIQFAKDAPGADWVAIGKAIARCSKPGISYYYARTFQPQDVQELQWRVILSADVVYMRLFAQYVQKADIPTLESAVVKTRNSLEILEFSRKVIGSSILRICRGVYDNNDPYTACLLATEGTGMDLQTLQACILRSGTAYTCYRFARRIRTANHQALQDRAVEVATGDDSGDAAALYGFARDVPNVDTGKLYASLVDTRWDGVAERIRRYCTWYGKSYDIGLRAVD